MITMSGRLAQPLGAASLSTFGIRAVLGLSADHCPSEIKTPVSGLGVTNTLLTHRGDYRPSITTEDHPTFNMGKMTSAKTSRRSRVTFSARQLETMEKAFLSSQYPDVLVIDELSSALALPVEKILTWFQNRRSKFRKDSKSGHIEWMRQQVFTSAKLSTNAGAATDDHVLRNKQSRTNSRVPSSRVTHSPHPQASFQGTPTLPGVSLPLSSADLTTVTLSQELEAINNPSPAAPIKTSPNSSIDLSDYNTGYARYSAYPTEWTSQLPISGSGYSDVISGQTAAAEAPTYTTLSVYQEGQPTPSCHSQYNYPVYSHPSYHYTPYQGSY